MTMAEFWESPFSRVIRWILYVPVGILILSLGAGLAQLFLEWLFKDLRGLLIIGVLLGGTSFIFAAGAAFWFLTIAISKICPRPKIGMVIFSTLYISMNIRYLILEIFGNNDMSWKLVNIPVMLVGAVIVLWVATDCWNQQQT
jgi:hypothetical protein